MVVIVGPNSRMRLAMQHEICILLRCADTSLKISSIDPESLIVGFSTSMPRAQDLGFNEKSQARS